MNEGIPIPTSPNGVYCAGCGETGWHAPDCPSLPRATGAMPSATLGEVEELRRQLQLEADASLFVLAKLDERLTEIERRLAALEAARGKK